jgi:Trm5-related predicted tRNA methylase
MVEPVIDRPAKRARANRRAQIAMSDSEMRQFLRSRHFVVVGTNGPGGWASLVTLRYGWHNDMLAFQSYTKSQKIQNLVRDSRITCLVEAPGPYSEIKGVQIVGAAELINDPAVVVDVMKASLHGDEEALAGSEIASIGEISAKRTAVIIHPERYISWDHSKLNGTY